METFNDIVAGGKPVLVDFYATWCQPCKIMHPVLEQVKQEFGDRLRIIKLDIDKNEAIAAKYGIQAVPTLMLFNNGDIAWRNSGAMMKQELARIISEHIG